MASTPTRKKTDSADQMLTPSTSSIQSPHISSFISSVTQSQPLSSTQKKKTMYLGLELLLKRVVNKGDSPDVGVVLLEFIYFFFSKPQKHRQNSGEVYKTFVTKLT
jgi:hypothetical protein